MDATVGEACSDLANFWHRRSGEFVRRCQHATQAASQLLTHLSNLPGRALQNHADQLHGRPLLPGLASLSTHMLGARRRPQPLYEQAYNPEDIKARLQGIAVYTVANKKNEFVLVTGEGQNEDKQLGLFFFNEKDAQALIDKIKEQNPKLAKQSQVLELAMDKVYDFATKPREATGTQGVIFRFMPDMNQVQKALELYEEAGIKGVAGFQGVPVFQADGLTVNTELARYTPLFFSKDDLDAAVVNAAEQREGQKEQATRAKLDMATQDMREAEDELKAADSKSRKAAQEKRDKAAERLQKYRARLEEVKAGGGLPRVEVGSLEEVIVKMEHDAKGDWGDVMFVPLGALSHQQPPKP